MNNEVDTPPCSFCDFGYNNHTGWFDVRALFPASDGWYLVVIVGHGHTYQAVDFWSGDDMQWQAEQIDDLVHVTHYRSLPIYPKR